MEGWLSDMYVMCDRVDYGPQICHRNLCFPQIQSLISHVVRARLGWKRRRPELGHVLAGTQCGTHRRQESRWQQTRGWAAWQASTLENLKLLWMLNWKICNRIRISRKGTSTPAVLADAVSRVWIQTADPGCVQLLLLGSGSGTGSTDIHLTRMTSAAETVP